MRKAGIRSRTQKKYKATTNSRHSLPIAPNLLKQKFDVDAADHVCAADIIYIPTNESWLYLSVILDLYNREVVGWAASAKITLKLTVGALQVALGRRDPIRGLIHHSDRGSQFASAEYQKILKDRGIICSMSQKGNCYENAVVESFFGRLKSEWVNHYRHQSRSEALQTAFP
jgi:transposase InsO family protein